MKQLIGRWLAKLYEFSKESRIVELEKQNDELQRKLDKATLYEIPSLKRQLDLEQAEIMMLKEKISGWRLEILADNALKQERIGDMSA